MEIRIEEIWFEKYRVITRLGHGGSADVFLTEHILLSAYRAIKRISKAERLHDFWLREARILKNLSHPSIPIIYDLEEDESYSYIIMEYLQGVSLKTYRIEHKITEQEIRQITIQICQILYYLHNLKPPLLYLDLKPENLMMCGTCVKLVDFGAVLPKKEWEGYKIAMGTRGYAAPELFQKGKIDERSDIYSFGMLLFFLFTGEAPKREKIKIKNIDCLKGISKEWKDIINHCLKYMPGMRFSSISVLEERILMISGQTKTEKSCRIIRLAGLGHGTSYVCLMIAFSLAFSGKKVAYRELWEHGITESLLLLKGDKKGKYPSCKGIRLFRGEEEREIDEEFDIEIQDYGRIEEKAVEELLKMEHIALVVGGICWERKELDQILARFEKAPLLCINFISGREFLKLAKYYREYRCLQIPYQPELFKEPSGQEKHFAQQLWEEAGLSLERG